MLSEPLYKMIIILLILLAGNSCRSENSELETAILAAGDNRKELLKVLNHYSEDIADSLKFKAAVFLIENMPGHFSWGGKSLEEYTDRLRESGSFSPFTQKVLQFLYYRNDMEIQYLERHEDIRCITADFLIGHIDRTFEMWEKLPWLQNLLFDEFCEYVLPYRIENEILTHITDTSYVDKVKNEEIIKYYDDINFSAKGVSKFYFPDYFFFEHHLPHPFNTVYKFECYDIGLLQLYHYRAAGIPSALDFIPAWGNTNGCHYWVAVIDGMYTAFLDQSAIFRKIPKIYRYTFGRKNILQDRNYIPDLFTDPFISDVTSQYIHTAGTSFKIRNTDKEMKYAYLSVFNNRNWKPVAYSEIDGHTLYFREMGYDLVYLPVGYKGNRMLQLSYPFILRRGGRRQELVPDKVRTQRICLKRKYHYNSRAYGGESMLGTVFECSNDSLFDNSVVFHKVTVNPHMDFQDVKCPSGTYKYWRIRSGNYCSMAEVCFTDTCNLAVNMQGMKIKSYENTALLFDKDPLTYIEFSGVIDFVFTQPVRIQTVRYLAKNDGNGIYPGNTYELRYCDLSGWQMVDRKVATADSVCFDSVPRRALYWLRNLTTGKEERIFTYEEDKIKFW